MYTYTYIHNEKGELHIGFIIKLIGNHIVRTNLRGTLYIASTHKRVLI